MVAVINSYIQNVITEIIWCDTQTLETLPARTWKKEIPGLIKMFQTIRNERISKFISSSWQRFKCLGAAQSVCHWRVAFVRQQIVQTRLNAGRCTGRTAQWAEHAVPWACPDQPASVISHNCCAQILSSSPLAVPDMRTRAPVVQLSCMVCMVWSVQLPTLSKMGS